MEATGRQKRVRALVGACGLLASAAGCADASTESRAPQLRGVLHATYKATKCPPGTPVMTEGSLTQCYLVVAPGELDGLGKVVDRRVAAVLHSTTNCPLIRFTIHLVVRTKGTIAATAAKRCVDPQADVKTLPFTVTDGTGTFAGARGKGTITVAQTSDGYGFEDETWRGGLVLPKR